MTELLDALPGKRKREEEEEEEEEDDVSEDSIDDEDGLEVIATHNLVYEI